MRVTVLAENTALEGFECEHGLCLYVEHAGKRYLIDTGASDRFARNAQRLGIDLRRIDMAFLSHAHYDHSGGYDAFFAQNEGAKVVLQSACKGRCYYKILGLVPKYIGIPEGMLERHAGRWEAVDGYRAFGDGVTVCPHTTPELRKRGKRAGMYCRFGDVTAVDDFSHEQTVVFEQENGLVLFNSCSHGGVENIVEEVGARYPGKPIRAFFGGFHMMGLTGVSSCAFSEREVKSVAQTLLERSEAVFYTGHCTGSVAAKWLGEVLGSRFVPLTTGLTIEC